MNTKPNDAQASRSQSEDKTSLADIEKQISELNGKLQQTTEELSQFKEMYAEVEARNKEISKENEYLQREQHILQQDLSELRKGLERFQGSKQPEDIEAAPYEDLQRYCRQLEAQMGVMSRVDGVSARLETINTTLSEKLGPLDSLRVFNANQTPFAEADSRILAQIEGANLRPRADSYSITRAAHLADAPVDAPAPDVAAP
ncbi:hypothetical protein [Arthrobacter sp. Cr_A7]|uniref:hypothetical protein n=1 Tax=Arthrobacter sp. Cr_A7 TaxID=3031017 RepID=UPI0023DC34AB|nr:hypothetical protein [Arthrobacter sp. Cr_A7]MDF2049533.1 hypothetical protein [Arthrobacter sp. Cr_A7]